MQSTRGKQKKNGIERGERKSRQREKKKRERKQF